MAKFVGVVYSPPADGFPHLAVMFNEKDMAKAMIAEPVASLAAGEHLISELAKGLVELAKKDGYA